MPTTELEIRLYDDGEHLLVDLRLDRGGGAVGEYLARGVRVKPEFEQLRALESQQRDYGRLAGAMLFADDRLRQGLREALRDADPHDNRLRVRLRIESRSDELHAISWESLHLPDHDLPLALNKRLMFSRYLEQDGKGIPGARERAAMRALIVVASAAQGTGLAPFNVRAEVNQARVALGKFRHVVLARYAEGAPTLSRFAEELDRTEPDIVYVVCHGVSANGETYLLLENDDRGEDRIPGERIARIFQNCRRRPRLVVMAVCHSGGSGAADNELAQLGPRLVKAGVPAVIAMRGLVQLSAIEQFVPSFFGQLSGDGRIDLALTAARNTLDNNDQHWWVPVLTMSLRDGLLWSEAPPPLRRAGDQWSDPGSSGPAPDPYTASGNGLHDYALAYDAQRSLSPAPASWSDAEPGFQEGDPPRSLSRILPESFQEQRLKEIGQQIDTIIYGAQTPITSVLATHDRRLIVIAKQAEGSTGGRALSVRVNFERARIAYLRGDFDQAEHLCDQVEAEMTGPAEYQRYQPMIDELHYCIEARRGLQQLAREGRDTLEQRVALALKLLRQQLADRRSPVVSLMLELLEQVAERKRAVVDRVISSAPSAAPGEGEP